MTGTALVAVHQPNYLPWLGFFDKLRKADVLVLLDDAQYARRTWINRVRIHSGGAASWLSVPVRVSGRYEQEIRAVEIDDSANWRRKHRATLERGYASGPGWGDLSSFLPDLLMGSQRRLLDLNLALIEALTESLGIDCAVRLASQFDVSSTATRRLADLTRAAGGSAYLSGDGASGYQEDEIYERAGVGLVYQDFHHPEYVSHGAAEPLAGLSVVDAISSLGASRVSELLEEEHQRWSRSRGGAA